MDSTRSKLHCRRLSQLRNALSHSTLTRPRPTSRLGWRTLFAAAGLKRAGIPPRLVLAPNDAEAVNQYAQFLSTVGQLEASLSEIERAQQLDPLSPIIGVIHAGALAALRRDDAAEAQIKRTLAAYPEFGAAHTWAATQYIDRKMYSEAEAELRSLGKLRGYNGDAKALLARGMADPAQRVAAVDSFGDFAGQCRYPAGSDLVRVLSRVIGTTRRALDEFEKICDQAEQRFRTLALESRF